jgi:hypothetical protein
MAARDNARLNRSPKSPVTFPIACVVCLAARERTVASLIRDDIPADARSKKFGIVDARTWRAVRPDVFLRAAK